MSNQDKIKSNIEQEEDIEITASLSPHKILIIDDDMWIQRLFSKYLVDWGFRPISAYNPYEGIALAIKHQPLIIFLDIIMPDVTGEILLKMLKAIEITSEIPIHVVSANFNKDLLSETHKDGAIGFLSKPISQTILYNAIKKSLPEDILAIVEKNKFHIIE